jgi:DNA-binding MurR/RpiR family transcriptional regulator
MTSEETLPKLDFNQQVSNYFADLTKSEKQIANFLRNNQNDAAFLSAAEIAEALDISEATVVRFARTLGYPSYPALRASFQDAFKTRLTHSSRILSRLNEMPEKGDIFERLTMMEIDYLTQALESVDREEFDKAVKLTMENKRFFVFGTGPSVTLVDLMQIRLSRFGKSVIPLKSSGREVLDSLLTLSPDDILYVICFYNLNPTLKLVLDYASEIGCKIILITDTLETLIGDKADVVLAAKRGPVSEFHSMVVPMTIINALLLSVADQQPETILPALDKLDSLRDRLKFFNAEEL